MNIYDMKLGDLKKIAAMFGGGGCSGAFTPHIGKKCIIRTYASGVHFGTVIAQQDRQVELADARRIWRFDAAPDGISLSEVANHGGTASRSKICEVVASITILDALEIIPTTAEAAKAIESAKVAKP
jgi:predicted metal-binding protein